MWEEVYNWYIGNVIKNPVTTIIKTIVGLLAATSSIYGGIHAIRKIKIYFRQTFKKKDIAQEILNRVNTGLNIEFLKSALGKPHISRPFGLKKYRELIYLKDLFDLQIIIDENDSIVFCSISIEELGEEWTPIFMPDIPCFGKLGVAKFETTSINFEESAFDVWGHQNCFYLERYYFGRPGLYKHYFLQSAPVSCFLERFEQEKDKTLPNSFGVLNCGVDDYKNFIKFFSSRGIGINIEEKIKIIN